MSTQSAAIAEIALSLPAELNNGALLAALTRAYAVGFSEGFSQATVMVNTTIAKLLEPRV